MNLYTAVNNVLKRLDDYPSAGTQIWTRAELELYVQDGYNAFCRQTKCIFDMFYPENVPTAGNYTAKWEEAYYLSGMIAHSLLGFSGGYWEQDYAQAGAIGPINHTQPWESDYLSTTFVVSRVKVADDNVAVDRVTHDFHAMEAEFTRWLQENSRNFQTTSGDPWRFSMDRDGIGSMRVVPAGSGNARTYDTVGTFGLLRSALDADGFGTWAPVGSWGVLREIPEHFPMGAPYGIPRRLYSDDANTRVEYFRLGKDLDENAFELPDRFVKYVEFYAQAKALERDGPGQDMALSQHFMERFGDGIKRMVLRMAEMKQARVGAIGSSGKVPTRPSLARLPWKYGRASRGVY